MERNLLTIIILTLKVIIMIGLGALLISWKFLAWSEANMSKLTYRNVGNRTSNPACQFNSSHTCTEKRFKSAISKISKVAHCNVAAYIRNLFLLTLFAAKFNNLRARSSRKSDPIEDVSHVYGGESCSVIIFFLLLQIYFPEIVMVQ